VFATGPPPVAIELADEAKQNLPARWALVRNGQKIGRLSTSMKYHDATDEFHFTYRYNDLALEQSGLTLVIPHATSEVRTTRGGDLKEQVVRAALKAKYRGAEVTEGTIDVRGVVRDGLLTGAAELKSPLFSAAGDLDPVPVKKGQPLNPLQPVNRLGNVSANQEWVVHESNPLGEALGALLYKKLAERGLRLKEQQEKESVVARVGGAPQNLSWQTDEVPCWVIEYRRKEPFARTWVRASDGKVLRQEAFEGGESLVFERED
ncbi:MAG: hypothetical protein ACKODX_19545, partial [Gemmata sp.]